MDGLTCIDLSDRLVIRGAEIIGHLPFLLPTGEWGLDQSFHPLVSLYNHPVDYVATASAPSIPRYSDREGHSTYTFDFF